jgi:DNA-binding MarR family transcriptional regulator
MSPSSDRQPSRTLYLVKRAETVVRAGLEACLQSLGVTPRQYITLSLLCDERDQSSADLARKAGITPQSMSETIAALAGKGLIRRQENPDHRRILMTRLTAAGTALLTACEAEVDAMEARLFSTLSASDLTILRHGLLAIVKESERLSA